MTTVEIAYTAFKDDARNVGKCQPITRFKCHIALKMIQCNMQCNLKYYFDRVENMSIWNIKKFIIFAMSPFPTIQK